MAVEFTVPAKFQIHRTEAYYTVYIRFGHPEIPDLQLVAPPAFGHQSRGNVAMTQDTMQSLRTWAAEIVKSFPAVRPDLIARADIRVMQEVEQGKEAV